MSISRCFSTGLRRLARSPQLALWIYLASVVLAIPLASAMRSLLVDSIGSSLVQEGLGRGFDLDWFGRFSYEQHGLGSSFDPAVVGMLPVLANFERLLDGTLPALDWTLVCTGVFFLLVWAFFGGGVISSLARPEDEYSRSKFFADSTRNFFRLARLVVISLLIYAAVLRWVAKPLHGLVERVTRDSTAETSFIICTTGVYALVGLFLLLLGVTCDYAKISLVTQDRRSALLAFFRGLGFVIRNPFATLGLYGLLALVGVVWVAAYMLIAPGPGQANVVSVLLAFVVGQVFICGRIFLKVWFLGSQAAMYSVSQQI